MLVHLTVQFHISLSPGIEKKSSPIHWPLTDQNGITLWGTAFYKDPSNRSLRGGGRLGGGVTRPGLRIRNEPSQ